MYANLITTDRCARVLHAHGSTRPNLYAAIFFFFFFRKHDICKISERSVRSVDRADDGHSSARRGSARLHSLRPFQPVRLLFTYFALLPRLVLHKASEYVI